VYPELLLTLPELPEFRAKPLSRAAEHGSRLDPGSLEREACRTCMQPRTTRSSTARSGSESEHYGQEWVILDESGHSSATGGVSLYG
jgi:hypothetical protein